MLKKNILFTALLMLFVGLAQAQEPVRPSNFVNSQLSEQLLNQTEALSSDKLVNAQAKLLRKHYLALVESGFSKPEALKIIVAMASQNG